jgi:hypothetical protein
MPSPKQNYKPPRLIHYYQFYALINKRKGCRNQFAHRPVKVLSNFPRRNHPLGYAVGSIV